MRKILSFALALILSAPLVSPGHAQTPARPIVGATVQQKRGPLANMPTILPDGVFYIAQDVNQLWVGSPAGNKLLFNGVPGAKGDPGTPGAPGLAGTPGSAATIAVGTVSALAPGVPPTVTNTGTSSNAVFAFGLPTPVNGANGINGTNGAAATVSVGTVATGAAGTNASVTNTGTTGAAVLNFTLPRGSDGALGATGATGQTGATGAVGATGPSGIVSASAPLVYDGTAKALSITGATTSAAGTMSATQVAKLNSLKFTQTVRVLTDANGAYTWTFPVAFSSIPTVQVTVEAPTSATAPYNAHISGTATTTSVSVKAFKIPAASISLLGLNVLTLASPANAVYVDITATEP